MTILPLIFVTLITSVVSQELVDYAEDGKVRAIEDNPMVPDNSDSVVAMPAFVDEGSPSVMNLTDSYQATTTNVSNIPLANGTKFSLTDPWSDQNCGYLMMKFLALTAVLLFLMIVVLLVWYSCSSAPHEHKFPTRVVLTPASRATPGRNYSRFS